MVGRSTSRCVILSDEETKAIMSAAEECADSECSIDDVSSLVHDLNAQEKILSIRLEKVMNMIAHLQHINEKKERKTDEVRAFVKDLLSVFTHSKSMGIATGLDAFDGPFDAYDVLDPKPWKAAKKD
jgi:hypothetical protein